MGANRGDSTVDVVGSIPAGPTSRATLVLDGRMDSSRSSFDRWDRFARVPLVFAGVIFIIGFSVFVIAPDLPPLVRTVTGNTTILTWFIFAVDYIVRVCLTRKGTRWRYVVRHPVELLAVLLPVFRAVRVVDLARQLPFFHARTGSVVRTELIIYSAAYSVTFVYFLALSTLSVERSAPDATIDSFGDAVWWAFVTLTTVGYGDMYPVTVAGRFFAVLLMLGGIVIIGITSGTVVSYITDRVREYALSSSSSDKTDSDGSA
ncbi:potassium channel family protein [Microbacterium sp. KSW4-16]|uniref:potassium channel family protein n=1 Tax=Microbacterium aurugineum TaxID=2851642 RepID=UPI0020BDE67B|nr:potassium channel family protein [Microbacterium aurugineum]MCK8465879.1 potassium channel family protein [Microbacterium aurugineum]